VKIALHPYVNEWPVIFRYEEHILTRSLDIPEAVIEHIGSTAVPGLSAKPVIDIVIGLPEDYPLSHLVEPMMDLGYMRVRYYDSIKPDSMFFIRLDDDFNGSKKIIKDADDFAAYEGIGHTHIYVVHHNSKFLKDTIKFRDHLRNNPADRLVYELLKKQLAENDWENIHDYTIAKTNFIDMILSRPSTIL
jgi:GrpB-like predicted nucleotidyltransferase (UPF0157 family)